MDKFPNKIKTFGSSMHPLLRNGDIVYLKKIKLTNIKVNDIICVRKNGKVFTHRALYKEEKYLITRGDGNFVSDGKIYPKNIIGIVYKIKRKRQILGIQDLYLLQSTFYLQEILRVKKNFEQAKIDFIFLKGLPLHLYYEGFHPKRIYADCDILISKRHSLRVGKILEKMGYKRGDSSLSSLQKHLKNKESEVTFYRISNGFPIIFDIHFEIVFMMTQIGKLEALYPQKRIDSLSNFFLKSKRFIELQEENFPILSGSNLFIYLLLHLFHHNFKGSYRYDFINTILKKEKINYVRVEEIIKNYKLQNFIYPCLLLLKKYYKARFPNYFLRSARYNKGIQNIIQRVNIFDDGERIREGVDRFKYLFYLSSEPFYKKILIVLNPQVFHAIAWVFIKRIRAQMFKPKPSV